MLNNQFQVTITLSAPELRSEIQQVSGVTEAKLIPIEQAEANAKGIGGFLLGKLQALINRDNLIIHIPQKKDRVPIN